jgi:ketosteroid isomerase-like protein
MSRVDPDARRRDVGGDIVTIVRSIDEAFGRGDVDAVVDAMTENVEWDESPGMPYGGVHLGRGEFVTIVFGAISPTKTVPRPSRGANGAASFTSGRWTTGR